MYAKESDRLFARERERERESCGLAQTFDGGVGGAKENIKGVRCVRKLRDPLESQRAWLTGLLCHAHGYI